MVSEKLKNHFGKVKKRLSELKPEDIAKFAVEEGAGLLPFVGPIIKDAIDKFSPDEREELIKELKQLSESQFKEIGEKIGFSVEHLEEIREITLSTFEQLRADHEEIKKLIRGEITIPPIQAVLKKEKIQEGEFFRIEPKWIDFEEGFVVERKEVDEIINKLENDNIQLVLGEPASGKSVILKNIGFKLAKKGHCVYIIELKKWSADRLESYFKEAQKIDDERTLIIVDDAHLQLSKCEELVRDFRYKNLRTKLIVGTRDVRVIKESRTEEFTTEESEFKKLALTEIHAIDAAENMIYLFLTKKHDVSVKHRIEAVSRGLKEYKPDLWYLSWALKTYDINMDTVDKETIYSAIVKRIRKINGEDVFLPLSVFYRFEIPTEQDFLEEQLKIEEDKINQLIELSEITQTEEARRNQMLSLNHSSIADLHFKAYQRYPNLGRKVRKNFQGDIRDMKYIECCLFRQYMKSKPTNSLDIVIHLGNIWFYKKGGETLIKELVGDKEIRNSIKEDIEREGEIEKIGSCIGIIAWTSNGVGLNLANSINTDALLSKIEKEKDIGKIGLCVGGIAGASKKAGLKFVDAVSSKIEREENMEKVVLCVGYIANARKEVGLKFVDPISSKMEKEEDIESIGWCVRGLTDVGVGLELAKRIDVNLLVSKIEKEEDIGKIRRCISDIEVASKEKAREIRNRLNPELREELQGGG